MVERKLHQKGKAKLEKNDSPFSRHLLGEKKL